MLNGQTRNGPIQLPAIGVIFNTGRELGAGAVEPAE